VKKLSIEVFPVDEEVGVKSKYLKQSEGNKKLSGTEKEGLEGALSLKGRVSW